MQQSESKDKVNLWEETINEKGESSIVIHKLKTLWKSCKESDHYFEWKDVPKRLIECKNCKMQKNIVIGIHKLENGKLSRLH